MKEDNRSEILYEELLSRVLKEDKSLSICKDSLNDILSKQFKSEIRDEKEEDLISPRSIISSIDFEDIIQNTSVGEDDSLENRTIYMEDDGTISGVISEGRYETPEEIMHSVKTRSIRVRKQKRSTEPEIHDIPSDQTVQQNPIMIISDDDDTGIL